MNELSISFDVRSTTETEKVKIGKLLKQAHFMWICPERKILTVYYTEWHRPRLNMLKAKILEIKNVKEWKNG